MLTISLDTNCIIALDEAQADPASHRANEAKAVRALVNAHDAEVINVGIVAISASERQKDNKNLESFSTFQQRLASLKLAHLELLHPMAYFDVTFWDASLWANDVMQTFERSIHEILFPDIPFLWLDYCITNGLDPKLETPDRKWRNAKCDVQAFWSHSWRKRDVFITSDGNFHKASKKHKLIELTGGRIETPASAVSLLGIS